MKIMIYYIVFNNCTFIHRVVLIGITEELFIVATDVINDLRKSRASVLMTDVDPDTVDLELEWVVPNLQVIPVPVHNEHVLDVRGHNDHHRYFLVSATRGNGSERRVWTKWMKYLAKHNPEPDQFLQEIPKSRISLGSLFHTDKKSSTEMLVKSSLIDDKKKKSSSILKQSKEKNVHFTPRPQFKNLIPIATDLYDTAGIVKEEQKESSRTCFCFPRKKKRLKH